MKKKIAEGKTPAAVAEREQREEAGIAERAYALWETAGCPAESELRHWLQAEEEVRRDRGMNRAGGD